MKTLFLLLALILGTMKIHGQNIEELLQREIEKQSTPSIQYMIFNKDSIIYEFQEGFAKIDEERKVNKNTTFHAFSTTKTITALAILQMVSKGNLDLNESIKTYLPELPYPSSIKLRHLLTHSSGIPNPIPISWIHTIDDNSTFNTQNFIARIVNRNAKTRFRPNQKYAYSNIEYLLLGQIIERFSGLSYEEYIEKNVFEPIGTTKNELSFKIDTALQATGYHKRLSVSNLILGFFLDKKKFMRKSKSKWKPFNHFYLNGYAYSGLISTPTGLMKYIQALLNPNSKLLDEKFMNMFFNENILNNNKRSGMCFSWFKGELNGIEYYTHAGGGGGYYCEIRIYPKQGLGSVIMLNRTGMTDERLLNKYDKYFLNKN